jgi:hypothetical protein
MNTHFVESGQAIRHDAFAARLIDGRICAINNGDAKPFTSCSDCSRQSGWSTTSYQYLGVTDALAPLPG